MPGRKSHGHKNKQDKHKYRPYKSYDSPRPRRHMMVNESSHSEAVHENPEPKNVTRELTETSTPSKQDKCTQSDSSECIDISKADDSVINIEESCDTEHCPGDIILTVPEDSKEASNEKLINCNGSADTVDLPEKSDNEKKEEEEESCLITCLYYSMQCCECTIM